MKCLITGAKGQDAHYLALLLQNQGHDVFGMVYRKEDNAVPAGMLVRGDLADSKSINDVMEYVRPDEVYNLGAFSHAGYSFHNPEHVLNINGYGAVRVFEAVRKYVPHAKVYQASTSELYGNEPAPQNEQTAMKPLNPYGAAKLYAHQMANIYRQQGLWVTCGILFNHVSMLSNPSFVVNRFILGARAIQDGRLEVLEVGNLDPKRDFGWSPEYVEGMVRMLRDYHSPVDMVLGTGKSVQIADLGRRVFNTFGLDFDKHVKSDPDKFRPVELYDLTADPSFARGAMGWNPHFRWEQIVDMLVEHQKDGFIASAVVV